MKHYYPIAGCLVTTFYMMACSPLIVDPYYVPIDRQKENYYYIPVSQNVPFLQEKHEGNIAANYSFGIDHQGIDLQGSYSPAEHLGLISNLSWMGTSDDRGDINRFELGAGYYSKLSPNTLIEVYAGGGFGNVKNKHYTGISNISTSSLFLQPSIGFQNQNRKFQFAVVPRMTYMHFNFKDSTFNNDREQFATSQFRLLKDKPNQVFIEPGVVFKIGGENTMVNLGFNISANVTSSTLNDVGSHFYAGINFRLFPKKSKMVE